MGRWTRRPEGSNWGDFGDDDRIGKMNLLTPERRLSGVAEVREGLAFCLSLPLDLPGYAGGPRKPPRLQSTGTYGEPMGYPGCRASELVCDDAVHLTLQFSTQWDALSHYGRMFDAKGDGVAERMFYNGFNVGEDFLTPDQEGGPAALKLGIEHLATACPQGRGVLVDLTREGTERRWVGYDVLMRAIGDQKVEVRPGDFLLLNTGYDEAILKLGQNASRKALSAFGAVLDGSDGRLLQWIADSDVVALCSDNQAVEGFDPSRERGTDAPHLPLHDLCLFRLGVHLGEMWRLGELAAWLRAHDRSAFLLTAPPLRLPGAVGSPANPIATV
jgi:kynurenine formamidase